jgi:hypothetical protein
MISQSPRIAWPERGLLADGADKTDRAGPRLIPISHIVAHPVISAFEMMNK